MPVYYMILVGYIIKFVICMALIKKKHDWSNLYRFNLNNSISNTSDYFFII